MGVDRDEAARAIEAFLRALGRDPDADPELAETGRRVADAFLDELCVGYTQDPRTLLRESALVGDAELVIVRMLPPLPHSRQGKSSLP